MKNIDQVRTKVSLILYPNSHDTSEGMCINYDKIHTVIDLLVDLVVDYQENKTPKETNVINTPIMQQRDSVIIKPFNGEISASTNSDQNPERSVATEAK